MNYNFMAHTVQSETFTRQMPLHWQKVKGTNLKSSPFDDKGKPDGRDIGAIVLWYLGMVLKGYRVVCAGCVD